MRQGLAISERRAHRLVELARTTTRRVVTETAQNEAKVRTVDPAHARRRFGYRRVHDLLRREGIEANHKNLSPVSGIGAECA